MFGLGLLSVPAGPVWGGLLSLRQAALLWFEALA